MNSNKTLYVTDLDGTLLNTKDRINSESIRIINELVNKGMLFTYATARSLVSASVVTEGLTTDIPVIAYNGAFIIHPRTGEIMPGKATKAEAIKALKELWQCDRVVSFGDAINDIPMFEISDECYAVENAVPELKALATGIVQSNDDDGVAKWLAENV